MGRKRVREGNKGGEETKMEQAYLRPGRPSSSCPTGPGDSSSCTFYSSHRRSTTLLATPHCCEYTVNILPSSAQSGHCGYSLWLWVGVCVCVVTSHLSAELHAALQGGETLPVVPRPPGQHLLQSLLHLAHPLPEQPGRERERREREREKKVTLLVMPLFITPLFPSLKMK